MMRRGDLAEYPVDWVLREAGRDRVSGGIELHTERPAVVYLKDGLVYLVLRDGEHVDPIDEALDDRSYQAAVVAEEIRQRAHAVEVLAELLEVGGEGYYFHHPLNDHPLEGSWGWDPEELLAAVESARAPAPEDEPEAAEEEPAATAAGDEAPEGPEAAAGGRGPDASSDDHITLPDTPPDRSLDLDAWRALQAMVTPVLQTELVGRLGGDAAAAALVDDLCARGVLVRESARGPVVVTEEAADAEDRDPVGGDAAPDGDDAPAVGGPGDADEDLEEPEAAAAGSRGGRRRRWGR